MRASAITLLIATGLGAMACGSGESPSNAGPPQPLENGPYQKPPSSYEDPPSTGTPTDYEKPPSTYQRPGGGPGAAPMPGPGAGLCDYLCAMAVANQCSEELDPNEIAALPFDQCVHECNRKFDAFGCAIEIASASSCFLDHLGELNCRQLEQIGEGNPGNIPQEVRAACSAPIASLSGCLEGLDNPGEGGECTISGRCVCDDDCEHCRCENVGDDASCPSCRNNGNN
jgi:hypothetical protein